MEIQLEVKIFFLFFDFLKSLLYFIVGECCQSKDTFQFCAAGNANESTYLDCKNATIKSVNSDGSVLLAGIANFSAHYVRYAYSNYPQCALYNKYGLPAGPFIKEIEGPISASFGAKSRNSPAMTPPMGLNSWNAFHCNVDERKMRAMADALINTGLAKVGFEYVNIDGIIF